MSLMQHSVLPLRFFATWIFRISLDFRAKFHWIAGSDRFYRISEDLPVGESSLDGFQPELPHREWREVAHFLLNEINISGRPALSSSPHTHTQTTPQTQTQKWRALPPPPPAPSRPSRRPRSRYVSWAAHASFFRPIRLRRNFPHISIAFSAEARVSDVATPHSSSFRPSLCPRSSRPTSTPSSAPTPAVSPPSSPSAPRRTPSVRSSTAAGRCSA